MITLTRKSRHALRVLAAVAAMPMLVQVTSPRPACAAQPAAVGGAPAALKLFSDSTLVPGDRISVEVVGHGPDVVLIPGLSSSRETWRRTAERLRGRYRLHLVQVAGFAGAPAGPNASGPVFLPTEEAIDAYIRAAGLKRPAVVGHSLGGLMTLQLALDHPGDVGKVMIVDALAFYPEVFVGPQASVEGARPIAEQMASRIRSSSDADTAKGSAAIAQGMITAPADQARLESWMAASDKAVTAQAMLDDMTTDLRPRVAGLKVPVTVIYEAPLKALAESDYGPAPQKTLVSAAPGAKHFLMYDDPTGFDAALDAFLAR